MTDETLSRDQNHITVLGGITDDSNQEIKMLRIDPTTKRLLVSATGSGQGSVTSVSVVSANGFAGTVATATTTPAITLTTTINSPVLAGNGTAISAATTTGSGSTVVLNGSPTIITPSIAAITVSGGIMTIPTGSSDTLVGKNTTDTLTNKNLTSGTNTFPTFNQNTTGTSGGLSGTPSITVATITTTGNIELGNASDTTLSRSSAGVIAVEGVIVPTVSSTNTLTNKRRTRRLVTTTQSATPTINTDNTDIANITGLAQAITSFTTNLSGTPVDGDLLEIRITDNGTARAITWGASFSSTTVTLPTTTVISTMLRVGFEWNGSTWACIAVA